MASYAVSPPAHAACGTADTGGLVTRHVNGRPYELYVPGGLEAGVDVPLLVTFHGVGTSGASHAYQTGWLPFAKSHGFIVAFPDGQGHAWRFTEGSPDVDFARSVVRHVRSTYCVDGRRIFAGGHSNGAFLAGRLACDAADLFAALVPYAGGNPQAPPDGCSPSEPVAVAQFHSSDDYVIPTKMGADARDAWVKRLACRPRPESEGSRYGPLEHHRGCRGNVEVMWRVYTRHGHRWPSGLRRRDMLTRMWTFLQAYPN